MANRDDSSRVGTAERTAAQQALDTHLNAGRLGIEEYSQRSAVAATAATAGQLAELFADLPAPHPKLPGIRSIEPGGRRRTAAVAAAVGVLVVGGIVAASLVFGGGNPSQAANGGQSLTTAPAAVPTTTEAPSLQTSTPDTSSSATDTQPPTSPGAGAAKYLSDLESVEHSSDGSISGGSATANGAFFGHSVIFENRCSNQQGGTVWAEYNLSRAYTTFTATIGISDEDPAAAKGTYRVLVDGTAVTSGAVASGTSKPIKLSVANALHIRLEVVNQSAAQSCSSAAIDIHNVWGNAQIS